MTTAARADEFEALRPHLLAVAYRLTGTYADAEDIVQDSWLRWHRTDTHIADLRAWLTTVVSRLALDRLRSAAHRREAYVGEWLPEPVVTGFQTGSADPVDPLAAVVAADDARFAAMVVLERLTPDQRVAFVLHDGFAVPFDEIADILGVSAAGARQLASRARRAAASAPPPDPAHPEIVGRLMAAMADGDMAAVVALLHPEVTFTGDANRRAPTAARVIAGSDKVARFLFGLAKRYGPNWLSANQLALVNGDLGSYTPGLPAADGYPELAPRVTVMTVRDGLVCAVWDIANPDKFTASPLRPRVTAGPRTASRG
ncbi:RNA polymerase sigma factor SigJ [Mycolicibacterium canariasense]|uniref:RNA polymerase sigma factor SigJ n=1 Tax=Mycolicibacterium canariasense TaxID=228230 RepID=A0A117IC87_MYCCR|nr:RNA polymerase sigma factor SigJ [Mycolicibacterium canariasense]MCV7208148.1 RNA polymerase sigma factor SigJ [Mycolicibacterium canariasense]ORV09508.1 RNA polymerase subunit sigma [Mycolicibacterium canariasense]GAS99108.1 RNA polymerase sigma factor SigJ [Mycolicibacterium canariasense]